MMTGKASREQGAENREYIRNLLKQKQPDFQAALQLAANRVEQDLPASAPRVTATGPSARAALGQSGQRDLPQHWITGPGTIFGRVPPLVTPNPSRYSLAT
jgi:hypothetical protein